MDQVVINWILSGFGALIGFLLNVIWQAVKDLQKADKDLTAKISEIEVLVAGAYVKKDDHDRTTIALFAKIDRIYDLLSNKADK